MTRILVGLALLQLICCAPRQFIMRGETNSLELLKESELLTFIDNWNMGEKIANQDQVAWIGSDSLIPKITSVQKSLMKGYIAEGSTKSGMFMVCGVTLDSIIVKIASIRFSEGKCVYDLATDTCRDPNVLSQIKCIRMAREANRAYIKLQNANYNAYSFVSDTGIRVYLAPGSSNEYLLMAGSTRSDFASDLTLRLNTEMHKGLAVIPTNQILDVLARSSSLTDIVNEMDIAQYLIWKNRIYNQIIHTRKYSFCFYNIPDENRIVKKVMPNDE